MKNFVSLLFVAVNACALACFAQQPGGAQIACDAQSFDGIIPAYLAVEAMPLSPGNILSASLNSKRTEAARSLPYVARCSDEPVPVRESYFQLANWWQQALLFQTSVAQVLAVKQGLTINSPACAGYYAASVRLEMQSHYSFWRHIPLPAATTPNMEKLTEFRHIKALWQQDADKLHYHLEAIASPYNEALVNALDIAKGNAWSHRPVGASCGSDSEMYIARRGVLFAKTAKRQSRHDAAVENVNVPRAPDNQGRPKTAAHLSFVVTNSWNDSVNGVLYVHDAITVSGSTEPITISASDFQLSMAVANGGISLFNGLEQAAPSYQKITALNQGTPQTTPEVDPLQDLGRIGSLRIPANQNVQTIVTFAISASVLDAKANRNVSVK